jgi:hypothetical protein
VTAIRGLAPGSTARVFYRHGDWLSPAHVRGLGEPLAEVQVDAYGVAQFDGLPSGAPLLVVGKSPQGDDVVRRTWAEGSRPPGGGVPAVAARQAQAQNVSQNAIADERPDVRSTSSSRETEFRRKPVPLDLARLAKTRPEKKPKNPVPRHHRPQPGEAGGPELPKGPGYDDDLGPAAA